MNPNQLRGTALNPDAADVFVGEIQSLPTAGTQSVTVKVQSVILGDVRIGQTIQLPYAGHGTQLDSGDRLAQSWDHFNFGADNPMGLVIRTRRRAGPLRPGDPVLVTNRHPETERIQALIKAISRTESRNDLAKAVSGLEARPDPAFAGALYARIWNNEALTDPVFANQLLLQFIGSRAVPLEVWKEIADDVVLSYALLPAAAQDAIVTRFAELAQRKDNSAALAGFYGLGLVARISRPRIPADSATGVHSAYLRMVASGMEHDPVLENALSV
jgi:hypothetical protein